MSFVRKIPFTTKEILDVFHEHNFKPMSLKELAEHLGLDLNTVGQRILRDDNVFFETIGKKPKIIKVREGLKEVVFYINDYKCFVCGKVFSPNELKVFYINDISEKEAQNEWNNMVPICMNCEKNPPKASLVHSKAESLNEKPENGRVTWEYIIVKVRTRMGLKQSDSKNPYLPFLAEMSTQNEDLFMYYEYTVLDGNNLHQDDNWHYLSKDEEKGIGKTARSLTNVLNHFGNMGWELVHVSEKNHCIPELEDFHGVYLKNVDSRYGNLSSKLKEFECIFKRENKNNQAINKKNLRPT
ncbi:MAG: winged helix-turn-helix domain-containing protein [Promethearchaeota archaeon]